MQWLKKKKKAKRRKGKIITEMSNVKSIFCETVLRGKGVGDIGITSGGNHGKQNKDLTIP